MGGEIKMVKEKRKKGEYKTVGLLRSRYAPARPVALSETL